MERQSGNEFRKVENSEQIRGVIRKGEENRARMNEFIGVYAAEEIEGDKKLVRKYEEKFANDIHMLSEADTREINYSNERAEALEVIIAEQSELAEWFGSNVFATRTTKYDDYFNGIDMVLEFDLGDGERIERIALAVDASNAKFDVVKKKIDRNIRKVKGVTEKPPRVKYFRSEAEPSFKGSLEKVIPVVVGIEGKNVDELIDRYASPNSNKEMAKHPVQRVFLEEIKSQLEMYLRMIETDDSSVVLEKEHVQSLHDILKNILEEKEDIGFEHLKRDKVFGTIMIESLPPEAKN